jgi:signal transduction histidine kinase
VGEDVKAGTLFWRLFAAIGISLFGTLVLGGLLITLGVQRLPENPPTHLRLTVAADLAASILRRSGPAAAERFLEGWGDAETIATLDGRCIASPDPGDCGHRSSGTERREVFHEGRTYEIAVSSSDDRSSFFLPPLTEPFLVGVPISLLGALLLARHIVTPVKRLGLAVRSVAEGRFDTRAPDTVSGRRDEIGALGRDIDIMAARLDRMTVGQKRLLHDVSHELRSPLSRLKVAAALVRKVPDRLDDLLSRIDREVDRIDGLVEEVLTLSRLESGANHSVPETVDLAALLEAVLFDAEFEARQKAIVIRRDLESGSCCRCSLELMRRGLENVIGNALKFSPAGSVVTVTAKRNLVRGILLVRVEDEGSGMSDEDLASAFEPFFRGRSFGASPSGYGLGLSIAKRAVDEVSGRISLARNETGVGLTITIEIPESRSPSSNAHGRSGPRPDRVGEGRFGDETA